MKLKLDENLGKTAATLFRSAGYDTQTVRGQGLSKAADREVIGRLSIGAKVPGDARPGLRKSIAL